MTDTAAEPVQNKQFKSVLAAALYQFVVSLPPAPGF